MNDPLGAGDGEEFGRRPLLLVDAKGYGDGDPILHREFQQTIPAVVRAAADAAGLRYPAWQVQAQGDALFAVLPAKSSEPALVDTFVRALEAGLRNYNQHRLPDKWLRLRATIHYGPASRGSLGFVGPGPVELARLNDSAALRAALRDTPRACLALGLSEPLYADVVRCGYTTLRPEWFHEAPVAEKTYRGTVWIWVPTVGAPASGSATADQAPATDATPPAGPGNRPAVPPTVPPAVVHHSAVHQTFENVDAPGSVFGLSLRF